MATRSKSKSKKKVWSTSKKGAKTSGFGKKSLKSELQRAIGFLHRGKLEKSYEVLAELDQNYPDTPDILVELANYYANVNNLYAYQTTCERLIALDPHQSLFTLGLANSYLATGSPMLALKTFRQVAEKWPNHQDIAQVQNAIQELEESVDECLADLKVDNTAEGLAIAEDNEQIQCYLNRGNFNQAKDLGLELLERVPQLLSVRNNVSMAYFYQGEFEDAIAQTQQVLDKDGDNIHALSNLIRYHYVLGAEDDAKALAPQLLASEADAHDPWIKKMEALSYLGDYQQVLDLYDLALESGEIEEDSHHDFFFHLGAVAIARTGDLGTARKIWKSVSKRSNFPIAAANLADSNQAIAQRHGAWAFEMNQWVSPIVIQALNQTLQQIIDIEKRGQNEDERNGEIQVRLNAFLDQYPHFNRLIPVWLKRGDPKARAFADLIARKVRRPEHLEALKAFALDKWGPDEMRYRAAIEVVRAKLMSKKVTLWIQGKQSEIILMAYEFHSEVPKFHSPEVEELLAYSLNHLKEARDMDDQEAATPIYEDVEATLKKAMEMEPDAPDLLYNLGACYYSQQRDKEAIAIFDQLVQESPEYVHGRVARAKVYIDNNDLDAAQDLLLPMLEWDRFHFDDFAEFSDAYLGYLMARDQKEGARGWLDMWRQVDPENSKMISWFVRLTDPKELMRLLEKHGKR
ncbi:MAG: tetratricopeptide repeat protein [Cyanobacteria bacterium P01_F01_bin.150]